MIVGRAFDADGRQGDTFFLDSVRAGEIIAAAVERMPALDERSRLAAVTVTVQDVVPISFQRMAGTAQTARAPFAALAEKRRPVRPVPPLKLANLSPWWGLWREQMASRVDITREQRMDRDRRRVYRRAVRRYKRLSRP